MQVLMQAGMEDPAAGTAAANGISRATDAREKTRTRIFSTGLGYGASYGHVAGEGNGRDLNPLEHGCGCCRFPACNKCTANSSPCDRDVMTQRYFEMGCTRDCKSSSPACKALLCQAIVCLFKHDCKDLHDHCSGLGRCANCFMSLIMKCRCKGSVNMPAVYYVSSDAFIRRSRANFKGADYSTDCCNCLSSETCLTPYREQSFLDETGAHYRMPYPKDLCLASLESNYDSAQGLVDASKVDLYRPCTEARTNCIIDCADRYPGGLIHAISRKKCQSACWAMNRVCDGYAEMENCDIRDTGSDSLIWSDCTGGHT